MTPHPVPILYVHHRPELGGAPQSLAYLLRDLDRDAFEPHVYCPDGPAAQLFRDSGAIVHLGSVAAFTHIWASVYRGRRWLLFGRELARLPKHLLDFRRELRSRPFALVHLNDAPIVVAALLARRARIPIVWHLRSALPGTADDLRSRLVRRIIPRLAAASIAINEDVAATYSIGAEVIPNSVDLERFKPGGAVAARAELELDPSSPLVTYSGFLYSSKGFDRFIRAAAILRDSGHDATFLVVGGAVRGDRFFRTHRGRLLLAFALARNYEMEARRLVEQLDLQDRVRFIPFTRSVERYYQASDVVVAPSQGPELGRPVIEAAASGVPVVASGSRNGAGMLIPGVTGLIVRPNDERALAAAIESLLLDPARRRTMGTSAREHAEKHFDPVENAARVDRIYRRIAHLPERTRVLFVHHRPQLGGAPVSLAELIRQLDRSRFEPHVYVPGGQAARLFEEAGAIVHVGPVSIFKHGWGAPYAGVRWLLLARELAALGPQLTQLDRLMRQYRFPIVHLNDSPLLAAAWIARRRGARVVWHLRSALFADGLDRRSRAVTSLIERWGDAAIAIDRDVAATFRIRLPLTVVHNSVRMPEDARDRGTKAEFGLPEDRVSVGFAGFIRRPKGWPELVGAAEILIREAAPVHFVVVGGGVRSPEYFRTPPGRAFAATRLLADEESAMRTLVAEKGLEEHFSFVPFTADTSAIYDALDVVTFPNQGIGLGRPVLEAAAHGRPVVASGSATGAGIVLPDRTGILLGDRGPDGIAEALRRLVSDLDLRARLGAAAAKHARRTFDPAANARAVEEVYDSLLSPRASLPRSEIREVAEDVVAVH